MNYLVDHLVMNYLAEHLVDHSSGRLGDRSVIITIVMKMRIRITILRRAVKHHCSSVT